MILEGNVNGQGGFLMLKNNSDNANTTMSIQNLDAGGQGTSEITFQNVSNANNEGFMMFKTRPSGGSMTERMRIESSGAIRSGVTSAIQAEKYSWFRPESDGNTLAYFHQGASANVSGIIMRHGRGLSGFSGKMISFCRNDGNEVGSITVGVSSTAFNTSSDYRLKENEVPISDGITRLKTLKPYRFNFKSDPTKTVDGFFAHEVTAVPEAIQGEKDAEEMQQIDQSKLVPLLTAALQEAVAEIETLKTKVAALEGS